MDKKKLLTIGSIIVIIVSIIAIIVLVVNKDKEEEFTIDGINLPTNKEILKESTIDNLKITDISLLTRDGISTYKATVTNESDEDIDINALYVIFYEGDTENKTLALYDTKISSKEEKYINITSELDLTNTTKIEYVLE